MDRETANRTVAKELSALGYPGFPPISRARRKHPAAVLLGALSSDDLDVRLIEALPWLAFRFAEEIDWERLLEQAKQREIQNRLGFVVTLARQLAARRPDHSRARQLAALELLLEGARLVREDTLCQ